MPYVLTLSKTKAKKFEKALEDKGIEFTTTETPEGIEFTIQIGSDRIDEVRKLL